MPPLELLLVVHHSRQVPEFEPRHDAREKRKKHRAAAAAAAELASFQGQPILSLRRHYDQSKTKDPPHHYFPAWTTLRSTAGTQRCPADGVSRTHGADGRYRSPWRCIARIASPMLHPWPLGEPSRVHGTWRNSGSLAQEEDTGRGRQSRGRSQAPAAVEAFFFSSCLIFQRKRPPPDHLRLLLLLLLRLRRHDDPRRGTTTTAFFSRNRAIVGIASISVGASPQPHVLRAWTWGPPCSKASMPSVSCSGRCDGRCRGPLSNKADHCTPCNVCMVDA